MSAPSGKILRPCNSDNCAKVLCRVTLNQALAVYFLKVSALLSTQRRQLRATNCYPDSYPNQTKHLAAMFK